MTEFVLLHGAFHTSWHWRKLIPELQRRGHQARAVDLPGPDPAATTESFVAAIDSAMGNPGDTVLVAHSAAGLWAPIVADRRPVRELVLLAALLPLPGHSWIDQFADQPMQPEYAAAQFRVLDRQRQGGPLWSTEEAAEFFYGGVAPAEIADAVHHMRPENASVAYREKTPLTGRPPVPSRYIWCTEDRTVARDWAYKAATDRFDARIVEFESAHSPFLSRPAALAELLTSGH